MPKIQIINREQFAQKRWQPFKDFSHAAKSHLVPIVMSELAQTLMTMPVAFIEREGVSLPVGVLGLQPGHNVYVAPNGTWAGGYVPAAFRAYPFHLVQNEKKAQFLAVDVESGLVVETEKGEPFYAADGTPAPRMKEILEFMTALEKDRLQTLTVCQLLARHGLLSPWPLKIKTPQGERELTGLLRIDEAALQQLVGELLSELLRSGALALAYGQLFSMQHLPRLGKLAEMQAKLRAKAGKTAPVPAGATDALQQLSRNGNLDLSGLF